MLKKARGILLILGYTIIILIVSTIWTEFNLRPPESGPLPVGILHKVGLEIRYVFLIGLFCFNISLVLTVKEFKKSFMIISVLGLVGLLFLGFLIIIFLPSIFMPQIF